MTIWISYGGSNNKLTKDLRLLTAHFSNGFKPMGSRMSGHHSNRWGVIPDTKENKLWIKMQKGISINREMNKINGKFD